MNIVYRKSLLILFIFLTWAYDTSAQRKDEKTKYIGIHESNMSFMNPTDTLSATIFLTHDSFTLVFMIANDSDYRFPMYRGTWAVTAGEEETDTSELKYDNGTLKKGVFEEMEFSTGKSINFRFDNISFYPPMRMMTRPRSIRK